MSRLQKLIGAFLVLAAILFLAAPLLLSSTFVKSRIEAQLSQLTGHSVLLSGDSSLSIYPYLGVTYGLLTVKQDEAPTPLMLADSIRARVGLLSALTGNPQVSQITLVKPRLYLEVSKDGKNSWQSDKFLVRATNKADQTPSVETIEISEGTIAFRDHRTDRSVELRTVSGTFAWPGALSPLTAAFVGKWRNKPVNFDISVGDPSTLAGGGESPLRFKARSDLLEVAFTGTASTGSTDSLVGALKVNSPDFGAATGWLGQPVGLVSFLTSFELSGAITADPKKMAINDIDLVLGDHKATGRLQLGRTEQDRFSIGGTLAFDSLNLPQLTELLGDANRTARFFDTDVDLRLSAEDASIGNTTLEALAATILTSRDAISFGVGQAQALGGTVSGTLDFTGGPNTKASLKVAMRSIALEQLADLFGDNSVKPSGSGNARLSIQFELPETSSEFGSLNGDGAISSSDGLVTGIGLGRILANTENSRPLRSASVFQGTTPFNELNVGFTITNGTLLLKDTTLKSSEIEASLQGRAELASQTLALRGEVSSTSAESRKRSFFIGGTVLVPLYVDLPEQQPRQTEGQQ